MALPLSLCLRHKPQNSDRFHVPRLREQIESSQALQHVLSLALPIRRILSRPRDDLPNVPSLRVHIAAHIHDRLRAEGEQLPYKCLIAPLSGRVDDERSERGRKVADGTEDLRRVARAKGGLVCEVVECRVVRREADRVRGKLDACNLCKMRGEGKSKETRATVGVYEVSWGRCA